MLGQLYRPRGLARETAQAVLQVDDPWACNVAFGCSNGCLYCYGPRATRSSRETWMKVRHPETPPVELVDLQLERMVSRGKKLPAGVFLSFLTEPFLKENRDSTESLIELLQLDWEIPVATSSKCGVSWFSGVRHGMTVVSLDREFWNAYESRCLSPQQRTISLQDRGYTWASLEPYPVSAIWKQDLTELLEAIKFVDLIVFGMWNYDRRARTPQSCQEYAEDITVVRDFCKSNDIRLHIKSDTLKFAFGGVMNK